MKEGEKMTDFDNKKVFSENLKYYMKLFNKNRNDICNALGLKYTTVRDWVKGRAYPRIDKIEMLANYFGIQKSDLIEKKTEEKEAKTMEKKEVDVKIIPKIEKALESYYELKTAEEKNELLRNIIDKIIYAKAKGGRKYMKSYTLTIFYKI